MDNIKLKKAFAAVFDKSALDGLLPIFLDQKVEVVGTKGTADYLVSKGVNAQSVVDGYEYSGRVKSLGRSNFVAILADKNNPEHIAELEKEKLEPIDAVIVDLYKPDPKDFPDTMDIGGQALIRAAIKNFENVAVAFDKASIDQLAKELGEKRGETSLEFRKAQAKKAAEFIAQRTELEADLFGAV